MSAVSNHTFLSSFTERAGQAVTFALTGYGLHSLIQNNLPSLEFFVSNNGDLGSAAPIAGLGIALTGIAGFLAAGSLIKPRIVCLSKLATGTVFTAMLAGALLVTKNIEPIINMISRGWKVQELISGSGMALGFALSAGGAFLSSVTQNSQNPTISKEPKTFKGDEITKAFWERNWISLAFFTFGVMGFALFTASPLNILGGSITSVPLAYAALKCARVSQDCLKDGYPVNVDDHIAMHTVSLGRNFAYLGAFISSVNAVSAIYNAFGLIPMTAMSVMAAAYTPN
jgi:hypothetical protein